MNSHGVGFCEPRTCYRLALAHRRRGREPGSCSLSFVCGVEAGALEGNRTES